MTNIVVIPDREALAQVSRIIRAEIIETSHKSEAMHLGGCLSCVDILVSLYFGVMSIRPDDPDWLERDRFILSKGHAALALYTVLAHRGYYPREQIDTFNKDQSRFTEHPIWKNLPGIDATTGSLGHGLGIACGMALAARINDKSYRTFILMSDGECEEGSVWEAALFAPVHPLGKLIAIIDYNKWQACGRSNEIMNLSPLSLKFSTFGWAAYEVDGHNIGAMLSLFRSILDSPDQRPVVIIAHTIKGKGVSFMEDDNNWHYRIPTAEEVMAAHRELDVL
ncbi:transketolase [Methanoregula sp. UBA64]|jgi:transketolase|uniref:transketolase n=1 Tax=Methanoregula sp. UBA64 TaxID=1915554 RepID=UPI0025E0C650|nr:transketolase [Methanoregula sp. UBA64]